MTGSVETRPIKMADRISVPMVPQSRLSTVSIRALRMFPASSRRPSMISAISNPEKNPESAPRNES